MSPALASMPSFVLYDAVFVPTVAVSSFRRMPSVVFPFAMFPVT